VAKMSGNKKLLSDPTTWLTHRNIMIKENEIDISEIKDTLAERGIDFNDNVVYIMPESSNAEYDLINEHSPDLNKVLKAAGMQSLVVRGKNHKYLALRSADIILPLIIGIPSGVIANFITGWIKESFDADKKIRLRYVKEVNGKYKEITIEGTSDEVKDILNDLKEH
jgi:hypothetical protein